MGNFGTVIITGGSGFIGRYLVKKILETHKYHRVVVVDNLSNSNFIDFVRFLSADQSFDYLIPELSRPDTVKENDRTRMRFYRIDVRNYDDIEHIFKKEIIKEKEAWGIKKKMT